MNHSSAMNEEPPSAKKLELIREFMRVTGIQNHVDSGSSLEKFARVDELGWEDSNEHMSLADVILNRRRVETLKTVYEKYRPIYQGEIEGHLNWEFTEVELQEMVDFFGSPTGQHYFDGVWRMKAYTGTNLEDIEQQLVSEAVELHNTGSSDPNPNARDD